MHFKGQTHDENNQRTGDASTEAQENLRRSHFIKQRLIRGKKYRNNDYSVEFHSSRNKNPLKSTSFLNTFVCSAFAV